MENKLINYEVSVWEDTYVAAAVAKESAEGSTNASEGADGGKYTDFNLTELREVKLGIIGSTNSSFGGNIFEPQLTSNVNGTHTFTFSIHTEYFNPMTGVIEHNPYVDWLVNERKIKLRRDDKYDDSGERGKWYDFIIKNISEDSVNKKVTYTCKDAHVCELSKEGFEIELSIELNNNMGSAQDLAKYVMEGTDWDVPAAGEDGSATIIQYSQPNAMWDGTTEREIIESKVQKFNPVLGETVTEYPIREKILTSDDVIAKTEPGNKPESLEGYKKTNEEGKIILYNFENWGWYLQFYYNGIEWVSTNRDENQYPYYEKLWGYTQEDFISARTVVNLIDNWKNFKNTYGFYDTGENSSVKQILLNKDGKEVTIDTIGDEYISYLKLEGTVRCDAFETKKTQFVDYWKNNTSFKMKLTFGSKLYDEGKKETVSLSSKLTITIKDRTSGINLFTVTSLGGNIFVCTPCVNLTEQQIKEARVGIYLTFEDEPIALLQQIELYPIVIVDEKELEPLYSKGPDDAAASIEPTTQTIYYLYDETVNEGFTSPDQYIYAYTGSTPPNGLEAITTEEKRTSIEASKSNRFNILQTIAEKFECWVRFKVEHAIDGSITSRKIIFVQELGTIEAPGFKYGLNLKGITRQVDSEQIVSKLIVQPNSNEFATGGTCTITRANGNVVRENFIYNLQYFTDMGLLDGNEATNDLRDFHEKLGKINLNKVDLLRQLDELYTTILGYKADEEAYSALSQEARDNLIDAKNQLQETTGFEWSWWSSSKDDKDVTYTDLATEEYNARLTGGFNFITGEPHILPIKKDENGIPIQIEEGNSTRDWTIEDTETELLYAVFFPESTNSEGSKYADWIKQEEDGQIIVYHNIFYWYYSNGWKRSDIDPREEVIKTNLQNFLTYFPPADREKYLYVGEQDGKDTEVEKLLASYTYYQDLSKEKSIEVYQKIKENVKSQIEKWEDQSSFKSLVIEIKTLAELEEIYDTQLDLAATELKFYSKKYDEIAASLTEMASNVSKLVNDFEAKYSRYIQEGTWISEDYTDDNKYFNDAKFVFAQSWQPKISYTINVVDIAAATLVPGVDYSMYTYNCGEKSTIEDTEFFGYDTNGRPKKVEIIIEELSEKFDTPDQNTIKVQNYTTYFDSLFHRIEAATQTVEFNTGKYARAADIVNPEGYIDISMLQSAFDNGEWSLSQLSDQSVTWADGKGIKISSPKDSDRQVRLANMGIFLTTDGGATWKTGITGDGIRADVITTGQLNTNNILIGNPESPMFRWDKEGISAYKFKVDEKATSNYNPNVYVRLNQYGLYGMGQDSTDYEDKFLNGIWENCSFFLGWKGFKFRGTNGNAVTIIDGTGIQIMNTSSGKPVPVFTADKLGNVVAKDMQLNGGLIESSNYEPKDTTAVIDDGDDNGVQDYSIYLCERGTRINLKTGEIVTPYYGVFQNAFIGSQLMFNSIIANDSVLNDITFKNEISYEGSAAGATQLIGGLLKTNYHSSIYRDTVDKINTLYIGDTVNIPSGWGNCYSQIYQYQNDGNSTITINLTLRGPGNHYVFTTAINQESSFEGNTYTSTDNKTFALEYNNRKGFPSTTETSNTRIEIPSGHYLYIMFCTKKTDEELSTSEISDIKVTYAIRDSSFKFKAGLNGLETNKFFLYDEDGNKYKITISGSSLVATKQ